MNKILERNPQILNNFLNYLLGIENYSINTIKVYNSALYMFFKFIISYMKLNIDIKKINTLILLQVRKSDVIAFLVHCNFTRDNSPVTRQNKLIAIRTFYDWLLSTTPGGYLIVNPSKDIPNIQKIEKIPKYLTLEQARKIQEVFTIKNSRNPIRNNAIISCFLSTGARASELINANLCDVNLKDNTINIIGKGKKERVLYLNEKSKDSLGKYLYVRNKRKKIVSLNEPLFLNKNGCRLGIDGVEDICNKAFELIGLENYGYTTHTLRHTATCLMYRYVTQDLLVLRNFLGHESVTTTKIYTHIYNKRLKEAVDKNPLNILEKTENREEEVA